jgi:hypothetical protein
MKSFLGLFLVLVSGIFANSQVTFEIKKDLTRATLTPYLEIHEDATGSLDFDSVRSKPFTALTSTNMGYTSSVFWVRWSVTNTGQSSIPYFLVYDSTVIDRLELFKVGREDPIQITGDRFPFYNRSFAYRNPIFGLETQGNSEETYYLRISSESTIPILLEVFTKDSFLEWVAQENFIFGLYYGWMLVMVLYNLFLYVSTRFKSYLFYVLFISCFGLFQFILNGLAFQYFWPNWVSWANSSLLVFMDLSILFGSIFAVNFLKTRMTFSWLYRVYQVVWVISGILFVSIYFLSYAFMIRCITSLAGFTAALMLFNGVVAIFRKINTARIFVFAFAVFILGVVLYSAKSAGYLPSNDWTNWTIQIGSALVVALFSLGLGDKINELSRDLSQRVVELKDTNQKLQRSDQRFRELFHGVSDIIFVLDPQWNFIDVNKAVTKHLGFKSEEIKGKNILEFIYKNKDIKDTYNRIFVLEKLEELADTQAPVDFQAEFRQKFVMEPKELYIKLQYVELGQSKEILGTASVIVEDVLSRFIKKERVSFEMNNYLRNAEIISQKLTSNLLKFTDLDTVIGIRTSLREIIINAIEHGNLNISFEEKTESMLEGNYLQFIQTRQNDPRYKDKKIHIEYVIDSKKVAYRITDEGKGFDHKKIFTTKVENLNKENIQHGRGIMMTRDVFDIVEYNEKGNQVSLVKYFR